MSQRALDFLAAAIFITVVGACAVLALSSCTQHVGGRYGGARDGGGDRGDGGRPAAGDGAGVDAGAGVGDGGDSDRGDASASAAAALEAWMRGAPDPCDWPELGEECWWGGGEGEGEGEAEAEGEGESEGEGEAESEAEGEAEAEAEAEGEGECPNGLCGGDENCSICPADCCPPGGCEHGRRRCREGSTREYEECQHGVWVWFGASCGGLLGCIPEGGQYGAYCG